METKANSFLVGVFALIAVAAAGLFTWWQAAGTSGATRDVVFAFPGSVAGLTSGSPVLFNGIKVGDVQGVSLDETDLSRVLVFAKVEESAPLKQDTIVAIETQGITGYASIGLSGGTTSAPDVFDEGGVPVIDGQQSTLSRLLASGDQAAERVLSILARVDGIIETNEAEVTAIVSNARTVSANLADASGDVAEVLSATGEVATGFRELAAQVGSVAGELGATVGRVDIAALNAILNNVSDISGTLAESDENIATLLANADAASGQLTELLTQAGSFAQEARQAVAATRGVIGTVEGLTNAVSPEQVTNILAGVERATDLVSENGDDLSRLVRNAGQASERLNGLLADASDVGTRLNELAGAADPQAVRDVLASAASIGDSLAAEAERLSLTLAAAETAAGNIAEASAAAPALAASMSETLAAARTAAGDIASVTQGIDPATVNRLTENAADLAEQGADLLEQSQALPASLDATLTTTRGAVREARGLLEAVDQTQIAAITADVASVTQSVRSQVPVIEETLQSAQSAVAKADAAMSDIRGVTSSAEEASRAARSLIDRLGQLTAGIDADAIAATVNNTRDITQTVADNREAIGTALREVGDLAERLSQSADRVDAVLASAQEVVATTQGLVQTEAQAFFEDASAAARSLRATSEQLNQRVPVIADNLTAFSGRGLQGLADLINQGRQTVGSLDRVLGSVEANPEQFLFGRRGDATYTPRGRE